MNRTMNTPRPAAIFMMGGPASGKSRARKLIVNEQPDLVVLDCDEIKETLPGYDPKNPCTVHAESKAILERQFFLTLAQRVPFVYDGTGTNAETYLALFQAARLAGYRVVLEYVPCTLELALERNEKRARTVPEHILREKYAVVEHAFELLRDRADSVRVHMTNATATAA